MRLREDGISWRHTGDEVVVLDLKGSEYFALNASGALLWERLASGPQTVVELEALLESHYALEPSRAAADVAVFLETLAAHGLTEE